MKRIALLLSLIALAVVGASAQTKTDPLNRIDWPLLGVSGTPMSLGMTCDTKHIAQPITNTSVTPNDHYICGTDGWELQGAGGTGGVNGIVTTSTAISAACGQEIRADSTSAITVTLSSTLLPGCSYGITRGVSAGVITINPNGVSYDGVTTQLPRGSTLYIWTDGTGYHSTVPMVPGTNVTFTPSLGGTQVNAGSGGSSPYAGYNIAFMGDSRWTFNGGYFIATTTPFGSCNGTNCTFSYSTVSGQGTTPQVGGYAAFEVIPGMTCMNWSMSKITALTGSLLTVAENTTPCTGTQTATGSGQIDEGNWTTPGIVANTPILAGANNIQNFAQAGQQVCVGGGGVTGLAAQYATTAHLFSPAQTGKPGILILEGGANDLIDGVTVSDIETCWKTLWAAAHADGWLIMQTSLIPYGANTLSNSGLGALTTGMSQVTQLNQWARVQSAGSDLTSPTPDTKFWDLWTDIQPSVNDFAGLAYNPDRGHPNTNGGSQEASVIVNGLSSRYGFPTADTINGGNKITTCNDGSILGVGPAGICDASYGTSNPLNVLDHRWVSSNGGIYVEDLGGLQSFITYIDGVGPFHGIQGTNGLGFGGSGDGGPWDATFRHDSVVAQQLDLGSGALNAKDSGLAIAFLLMQTSAPSGSCPTNGRVVMSQDMAITFCHLGTWTSFNSGVTLTASTVAATTYVADSGTADVYVATLTPAITSYTAGLMVRVKIANTNTITTPTLNVNTLGTKTIVKNGAGTLLAGDVAAGQIQIFQYDGTNFQLLDPATVVGNVIGSLPIVVTPTGSTYSVGCPSCGTSTSTAVNNNGGATVGTSQQDGNMPYECPDTSGSSTAQVCNSTTSFTVSNGNCFVYKTTTTNSGTGLTLNPNALGVKSIAIPGSSGWTTTLTAGIIPANKPLNLCYDGTNLNVQQTGTVSVGGGGVGGVPTTIPNLYIWLDANQLTGLSNGDPMVNWPNLVSGPIYTTVANSSSANSPHYETGVLNGLPVVRLNGSGWLDSYAQNINLSRDRTIFIVVKFASIGNAYNALLSCGDGALLWAVKSTGATAFYFNTGVYDGTGAATLSAGTFYTMALTTGYNNFLTQVNGATDFSVAFGNMKTANSGYLSLGNDEGNGGRNVTGDVAEVIMYNRALTTAENATITAYLRAKYAHY